MNSIELSHLPAPPVLPTAPLVLIESWYQMVQETQTTGVALDDFWLDRVIDGVACFLEWHGPVRATALAVWGPGRLRFAENGLPTMEALH